MSELTKVVLTDPKTGGEAMTLIEAIAVYLTLFRKPDRTEKETFAFNLAWEIVRREGDRIIMFEIK